MQRSSRSGRVTMSPIPFRTSGRWYSKIFSSLSEYNSRVLNPDPVDKEHNASDVHAGIVETLSKASSQPFPAAIDRSRNSRGNPRTEPLPGSTIDFSLTL